MTKRRTLSFSIFATALLALCLPAVASAQWNRYPDNQRTGDRYLRDSVNRLDRLSKDFEREVDRTLDRSRRDGTRNEDRINEQVRQFRSAVSELKSHFGNGRDLERSRDEAQRVLQEARQIDRIGNRPGLRVSSLWTQIRQELNVIARAYGSFDRRTNSGDLWRRLPG